MNTQLLTEYQKQRDAGNFMVVGHAAECALRAAHTKIEWDRLEDAGLVKLEWKPDESPDLSWLDQDCYKEDRQGQAIRRQTLETAERDGCWGRMGYYRIHPDGAWEIGDSVWGFIGADAHCYESDIMAETIAELKRALKARCPRCRKNNLGGCS